MAEQRAEKPRFGRLSRAKVKSFGPLSVSMLVDTPRRSPFSVLVVSLKPGGSHPAIRHDRTWEFFLILRGSNRATIGRRTLKLRRGDYGYLPPGSSHAFTAGRRGVDVLVIFSPAMDFSRPDIAPADGRK